MASLSDFIQGMSAAPNLGNQFAGIPAESAYYLNNTGPALASDAAIAQYRNDSQFANQTVPQMQNQGAAQGNFGSTGLATQAKWAGENVANTDADIARMLARNTANIGQQKVLSAMGGL